MRVGGAGRKVVRYALQNTASGAGLLRPGERRTDKPQVPLDRRKGGWVGLEDGRENALERLGYLMYKSIGRES